jgi:membrane protease YdiL (CAAX protease family)
LSLGGGQRMAVLVFYFFAIVFGISGLFLQSQGKFYMLFALFFIMLSLVIFFSWWEKKKLKEKKEIKK